MNRSIDELAVHGPSAASAERHVRAQSIVEEAFAASDSQHTLAGGKRSGDEA